MTIMAWSCSIGVLSYVFCRIRKKGKNDTLYLTFFAMYIAAVGALTLFCGMRTFERRYNLIPFSGYFQAFERGDKRFFFQEIQNVLLFIPFGVFWGIREKKVPFVVLCGLIFSLLIECIQIETFRGVFDVNDILWNTVGALLGVIYIKQFLKKIKKRKNKF